MKKIVFSLFVLLFTSACVPATSDTQQSNNVLSSQTKPYDSKVQQHVKNGQSWLVKFSKSPYSYILKVVSKPLIDFGSADPYFLGSADGHYAKISARDNNTSLTDYLLVHTFPDRKLESGYPKDVYAEKQMTWCLIKDVPGKTKYFGKEAFVGNPNDFAPILTGRKPYDETCEMTLQ